MLSGYETCILRRSSFLALLLTCMYINKMYVNVVEASHD